MVGFSFLLVSLHGQEGTAPARPVLEANSGIGRMVTCPTPTYSVPTTETLTIPHALYERAKLKARLSTLLHDSLYDDAKGIVNVEREREIKKLANELRK